MSGHSLWRWNLPFLSGFPFLGSAAISVVFHPCTFQLRSPNSCSVACTLLDHMAETCEKPTAEPHHLGRKKSCVFVWFLLRCFFHLASEFLNQRVFFRRYEFHIECTMAFNSSHTWHQAVQLKTRAPNPPEKDALLRFPRDHAWKVFWIFCHVQMHEMRWVATRIVTIYSRNTGILLKIVEDRWRSTNSWSRSLFSK